MMAVALRLAPLDAMMTLMSSTSSAIVVDRAVRAGAAGILYLLQQHNLPLRWRDGTLHQRKQAVDQQRHGGRRQRA
jgi:hypothetical protein